MRGLPLGLGPVLASALTAALFACTLGAMVVLGLTSAWTEGVTRENADEGTLLALSALTGGALRLANVTQAATASTNASTAPPISTGRPRPGAVSGGVLARG